MGFSEGRKYGYAGGQEIRSGVTEKTSAGPLDWESQCPVFFFVNRMNDITDLPLD